MRDSVWARGWVPGRLRGRWRSTGVGWRGRETFLFYPPPSLWSLLLARCFPIREEEKKTELRVGERRDSSIKTKFWWGSPTWDSGHRFIHQTLLSLSLFPSLFTLPSSFLNCARPPVRREKKMSSTSSFLSISHQSRVIRNVESGIERPWSKSGINHWLGDGWWPLLHNEASRRGTGAHLHSFLPVSNVQCQYPVVVTHVDYISSSSFVFSRPFVLLLDNDPVGWREVTTNTVASSLVYLVWTVSILRDQRDVDLNSRTTAPTNIRPTVACLL